MPFHTGARALWIPRRTIALARQLVGRGLAAPTALASATITACRGLMRRAAPVSPPATPFGSDQRIGTRIQI